MLEITAVPTQTPKMYQADRPACFMPAALESPSGTFERKTASTVTALTTPLWDFFRSLARSSAES
jgi:hypothetical protein